MRLPAARSERDRRRRGRRHELTSSAAAAAADADEPAAVKLLQPELWSGFSRYL
jgi:hypothetical protein